MLTLLHKYALFVCYGELKASVWVLSNSVAKGLLLFVGDKASQTARFAEMFDRFFDCLNSSSLSADKSQRSMMLLSKETRQGLKLHVTCNEYFLFQ